MIERELADLLLKLQAAHQEAAQNDAFWTPAAIAFHWNHRRVKVNRLSPEQQEAYKQGLLTEFAEAGSAKAWAEKLIAQRRKPDSAQTESASEFDLAAAPTTDPASEEPPSPTLTQPIDYASKARGLLGGGKSPIGGLWNLVHDPAVDWADDTQNWKKAYLFACLSELVYLRMSKYELRGKDRYKVIPSAALQFLLESDMELDLGQVMTEAADVRAVFTDSESLVIGIFDFNRFIAVAVRGTMTRLNKILGDLTVDLDAKRHWIDQRAYHVGFYDDAKGALGDLIDAVGSESKPVYFTGHSMGGAISGLLPSIWREGTALRLMTPYTFASPRFGNEFVAETYRNYAYVRAADPVPHVPTRSMGYCSSGWPPTMLPTTDSWLSGWKAIGELAKDPKAHKIEQYRKLVGEEANLPYFAAQVYYDALKELLVDPKQP
jgi:Lipase (class 3)